MSFIDDFLNRPRHDVLAERMFNGFYASPYIKDIAKLRLETLKDHPFLYRGDFNKEVDYLERTYLSSNRSCFLLYFSDSDVVGGIGITPLDMLSDDIKEPFIVNGMDTSKYMHIGEPMLLKGYRGRGLFRHMLSFAEQQSKSAGKKYAVFLHVERETADWGKYGYCKVIDDHIERKWLRSDTGRLEAHKLSLWEKPL